MTHYSKIMFLMSKEKENSPASKSLFSFYTLCAIVSLLIINIGMHAPFLLTDYSGEPDGASIINIQVLYTVTFYDYALRTKLSQYLMLHSGWLLAH
jgi:hypothetical protein